MWAAPLLQSGDPSQAGQSSLVGLWKTKVKSSGDQRLRDGKRIRWPPAMPEHLQGGDWLGAPSWEAATRSRQPVRWAQVCREDPQGLGLRPGAAGTWVHGLALHRTALWPGGTDPPHRNTGAPV